MRTREQKTKRKGQESTIGKIIYGFLLFLPLFAIGVTCGYAMFNKNAYKSYTDISIDKVVNVDATNFDSQTMYNYKYKNASNSNTSITPLSYISITATDMNISQDSYNQISNFTLRSNNKIWFLDSSSNRIKELDLTNNLFKNFNMISSAFANMYNVFDVTYEMVITNKLDNVFYYSIDKVQQSPLFNWAQNSIIYTTTASTCNALSITTPFVPLLLSYWLIISVMYFLYDIALMLVWILHRKIHELQDSI